jgi:hypothetical protein
VDVDVAWRIIMMTFFWLGLPSGYFETLKEKHIGGIFYQQTLVRIYMGWKGRRRRRRTNHHQPAGKDILLCFFLRFFCFVLEWTTTEPKETRQLQATNKQNPHKKTPNLLSILPSQCHFARFYFLFLLTPFFRFLLLVFLCVVLIFLRIGFWIVLLLGLVFV